MSITIGLVIEVEGTVDIGGYKTQLRSGVTDYARENNVNLICFAGGALHRSPYHFSENQRNIIYGFISKNTLDGIIIVSTIAAFVDKLEKDEFYKKIKSMPVLFVGDKHPEYPCVIIDNKKGMKELTGHMIKKHGLKKIAFIKGVAGHRDTEERYEAFLETLRESGIRSNENLVIEGDYLIESGGKAIQTLLDERHASFDGVIASNDHMAYGAMEELKKRGFSIPGSMAVSGFDDSEKAAIVSPSLTTVRQPVYEMGKEACALLIRLIKGENIPAETRLDSKTIIRQSCGCIPDNVLFIDRYSDNRPAKKIKDKNFEAINQSFMQDVLKLNCRFDDRDLKQVFESLTESVIKEKNLIFLKYFTDLLTRWVFEKKEPFIWQDIISLLNIHLTGCFNDKKKAVLDNIIHQSRILIGDADRQFISAKKIGSEMQLERLNDLTKELFLRLNFRSIMEIVAKKIPLIGINTCFISLFEKEFNKDNSGILPEDSRLILAYHNTQFQLPAEGMRFKTRDILPQSVKQELPDYSLIIEPLFLGEEQLGFMAIGQGPEEGIFYEIIRAQLSNSLYSAALLEKHNTVESKLRDAFNELEKINREFRELSIKDELTGLFNRRGLYMLAEQHIRLVQREKGQFMLIYIDLDGLKKVNDSYGHNEGDFLIRSASVILNETFRKADIIARVGGDEFVIIVINSGLDNMESINKRLQEHIEAFNEELQKPYKISMSMGLSQFDAKNNISMDELIEKADKMLYDQKKLKRESRT